jgi:cytochrome P450
MNTPPIDLTAPETYAQGFPHELFRRLRAEAPVSFLPEASGPGLWAVSRHQDVLAVLRDPATYSSSLGGVGILDEPAPSLELMRQSILYMDPPRHTAMRRLVAGAFHSRRMTQVEPRIAEYASQVVGGLLERGGGDFVLDIAGDMAQFVICEMVGIPPSDRRALYNLISRINHSDLTDPRAAEADAGAALEELLAYSGELAHKRRAHPEDDVLSELVAARIDGQPLSDLELRMFVVMLFGAGSETTRALISGGTLLLLEQRELWARLAADLSLLPGAIEEMLRYLSPVIYIRRTATSDTTLGGQTIRAGDKVVVFFPSANRDESVFAEPGHFNPARSPNAHVAFGFGPHFCIGATLGRLECLHVFREVLTRLPRLECSGPVSRLRSSFIDGLRSMPVRA